MKTLSQSIQANLPAFNAFHSVFANSRSYFDNFMVQKYGVGAESVRIMLNNQLIQFGDLTFADILHYVSDNLKSGVNKEEAGQYQKLIRDWSTSIQQNIINKSIPSRPAQGGDIKYHPIVVNARGNIETRWIAAMENDYAVVDIVIERQKTVILAQLCELYDLCLAFNEVLNEINQLSQQAEINSVRIQQLLTNAINMALLLQQKAVKFQTLTVELNRNKLIKSGDFGQQCKGAAAIVNSFISVGNRIFKQLQDDVYPIIKQYNDGIAAAVFVEGSGVDEPKSMAGADDQGVVADVPEPSVKEASQPSFWKRHKGKIMIASILVVTPVAIAVGVGLFTVAVPVVAGLIGAGTLATAVGAVSATAIVGSAMVWGALLAVVAEAVVSSVWSAVKNLRGSTKSKEPQQPKKGEPQQPPKIESKQPSLKHSPSAAEFAARPVEYDAGRRKAEEKKREVPVKSSSDPSVTPKL